MLPPSNVKLGTLTQTVLTGAVWKNESQFPSNQGWADDFERVLSFLLSQDTLERFLPRLRAQEWKGALAEARTGYFFHRNNFKILRWDPEYVTNHPGDLEIQWRNEEPVFVEVKGPGWQGELTREEIQAGRKRSPKHINGEARSIDPVGKMMFVVKKNTLQKLSEGTPNLIAIVDDFFVSLLDMPRDVIAPTISEAISGTDYRSVSGIMLLNPVCYDGVNIEYRSFYVPNEHAAHPLPDSIQIGLLAGNSSRQWPVWFSQ